MVEIRAGRPRKFSTNLGVQSQSKRFDHFENGIQTRTAVTGECLVKTLARQAGVAGHLGHPFGASDVAKRLGDECGISIGLFETCFEISGHLLGRPEVFCNVVTSCSRFLLHANQIPL